MLLHIEPEIEDIFRALSLEEQTILSRIGMVSTRVKASKRVSDILEHEKVYRGPCPPRQNFCERWEPVLAVVRVVILAMTVVVHRRREPRGRRREQ